ncbi:6671_t:CDS:2 [Ambispora gerdemannii]|uniref:6671_t:CDS:1 n=1 Tax=Ambispora gerdemannii TaxID=144530 RepID=A0A9N8W4J7_9GLOM|nr:6671_t:CDS:2 [Ambispora gerdemannii]
MLQVESLLLSKIHYQQDPSQQLSLQNPASCSGAGYTHQNGSAFWTAVASSSSTLNNQQVPHSPVSSSFSSDEDEIITKKSFDVSPGRTASYSSEGSISSSPLQSSSGSSMIFLSPSMMNVEQSLPNPRYAQNQQTVVDTNFVVQKYQASQTREILDDRKYDPPDSYCRTFIDSGSKKSTSSLSSNLEHYKLTNSIPNKNTDLNTPVIAIHRGSGKRMKTEHGSINGLIKDASQSGSYESQSITNRNVLCISPESTLNEFSKMHITHTSQQQESYPISLPLPKLKMLPPPQRAMSDTFMYTQSKDQHKRSRSFSEEENREIHAFMSSHDSHRNHDSKSRIIAASSRLGPNQRYFLQQQQSKVKNENFNGNHHAKKAEKQRLLKTLWVSRDTASLIIEVIWSHFHINPAAKIIPLRVFLQETLRRSRTSYSTLQTALFYLFRIKTQITSHQPMTAKPEPRAPKRDNNDPATCGRRMFLAALIIASKYLQDRNYSNKAWSKISGLPVKEINQNEIVFLKLIDYNLFISEDIFKRWSSLLLTHIQAISGSSMKNANSFRLTENQREVERFREKLRTMDPKTMECQHNRGGDLADIFLITPDQSAPATPQESSDPINKDTRNVQKLSGILSPQEMDTKMQTENNGSIMDYDCSSSTHTPTMIYAQPNSQ